MPNSNHQALNEMSESKTNERMPMTKATSEKMSEMTCEAMGYETRRAGALSHSACSTCVVSTVTAATACVLVCSQHPTTTAVAMLMQWARW